MPYDPTSPGNRTYLALALKAMLTDAGFVKVDNSVIVAEIKCSKERSEKYVIRNNHEEVWERPTNDPRIRIRVYTTITGSQVRSMGEDAIRVAAIYKQGDATQGLIKQRRVNRTGVIKDIVERTRERMRDAWKACRGIEKCHHCGAPKFKSKKNNMVCADFCWTKKDNR